MRNRIIQSIKNFDLDALESLLDNEKSYMDVSKSLFISTLQKQFEWAKVEGCHAFDDVFFGICERCNIGCEGMTFLSNSGHYLDIFIESKDGFSVDDIYVCNKLTNLFDLGKRYDLGFSFDDDEKVSFEPTSEYLLMKEQYERLQFELNNLEDGITLDKFVAWYAEFNDLNVAIEELDVFSGFNYDLFGVLSDLHWKIIDIIEIKTKSEVAIEALIDYQIAKTERDQLIWFFENEQNRFVARSDMDIARLSSDSQITFSSDILKIKLDISGYEYVLDYFLKLEDFYNDMMEKYSPLPEHYQQSETGEVICSLGSYLHLHDKYADVVQKYRP